MHRTGESWILPCARAVMEGLEVVAPSAMKRRAMALAQATAAAPSTLANVEESLRRADFMFYSAKRWEESQ